MSKGKIGIVTITVGPPNFGNKLQNYAVQVIVERLGYQAETILDCRWAKNPRKWATYIKSFLHIVTRYHYSYTHLKSVRFRNWSEKYLKYCPIVLKSESEYKLLRSRFDYCVVGSDQIWNPEYSPDYFSFAAFVQKERRIALSPSFGAHSIQGGAQQEYANYLKDFHALSSREKRGTQIIEELTGRHAETLIDPTMMLAASDWDEIAISPKNKNYILYYHIGNDSNEYSEYVKQKGVELRVAEIVNLSTTQYGAINPSEFVGYIKNATLVVTDSFHGSVFALLYRRPLTILKRISKCSSMNSRMETLMSIVNVPYNNEPIFEVEIVKNIDNKLSLEREKVWKYLKDALDE